MLVIQLPELQQVRNKRVLKLTEFCVFCFTQQDIRLNSELSQPFSGPQFIQVQSEVLVHFRMGFTGKAV